MAVNVQQTYQMNQITTASPQELTLLLYQGGIKFLKMAIREIEGNQMKEAHEHIIRVQDIITELQLGLNRKLELSNNLDALYDFMKQHLVQANYKKDVSLIKEVIGFFEEFYTTWKQAMELAKKQTVRSP